MNTEVSSVFVFFIGFFFLCIYLYFLSESVFVVEFMHAYDSVYCNRNLEGFLDNFYTKYVCFSTRMEYLSGNLLEEELYTQTCIRELVNRDSISEFMGLSYFSEDLFSQLGFLPSICLHIYIIVSFMLDLLQLREVL